MAINKRIRFIRGTESQSNAFTGYSGEITVDTTTWTLRVHDGVTAGGHVVAGSGVNFDGSYASLTGKPTIPSIAGLATETYVDSAIGNISIPSISGLATETYVNSAISSLVNGAGTALDTLNELSAALGNDANFATTVNNSISLKANSADLATVATSGAYADLTGKPTIPADISDLTDTGSILTSITGDITFAATTISAADGETITIQTTNQDSATNAKVIVDGEYGAVKLESYALEDSQGYYAEDSDYTTGEWISANQVRFTGAANMRTFLDSILGYGTTWSFSVDGGERSVGGSWSYTSGTETLTITTDGVTGSGSIDQIVFYFIKKSYINVDSNDYEEVAIRGSGIDIGISTDQEIQITSSNGTYITGRDDLRLESNANFRLTNNSTDQPIQIRTNASSSTKIWSFNPNGGITFPDSTTQTTAYIGPENPFNQDLDSTDSPNFVNLGLAGTAGAGYATLSITDDRDFVIGLNDTVTGSKVFEFGRDGSLSVPGITIFNDNIYGGTGNRLWLGGSAEEGTTQISLPNNADGASQPLSINNVQGGGVQITTGAGNWTFGQDGSLQLPGSIDAPGAVILKAYYGPPGTYRQWSFDGAAGNITFPDSTVQTTAWTNTFSYDDLTDKPTLFSGAYADLTGKPTIPTLGNFSLSNNTITTSNGDTGIDLVINGGTSGDPPTLVNKAWRFVNDGSLQFRSPMNLGSEVDATITSTKVGNWDTAHGWGDHATEGYVKSDTTGITGADQVTNMVTLTQAEYDAITPNASTVYFIVG